MRKNKKRRVRLFFICAILFLETAASKRTAENKKAEELSASKYTIAISNTRNGLHYMVPMGGVEPPRAHCTIDSESILSTNSNTSTGAEGGSRTRTVSPPPDFESGTSTNSITSAYKRYFVIIPQRFYVGNARGGKSGDPARVAIRSYVRPSSNRNCIEDAP